MNAFYLVGLAVAGIVLLKKKPGDTVITMDPIDVKPLPYSPAEKTVVAIHETQPGYINPGIPSGTGTPQDWISMHPVYSKLHGLNEYTE
jgi:hypothetical protein